MAIQWGALAVAVGIPVGLGFGVSIISAPGLLTWFPKLKKPWWQPPAFLFGPIWSTLYTFMGLASYLVWEAGTPLSDLAFKLYGAQLVFNLAWQPLFFNLQNLEVAQIDNLAAFGVAFSCALAFRDINRTAGLLFIPYVAFLAYTNCLNFVLGKMNPGGVPAGEGSSPSTLTEDLAHPQDFKNPGQDGYRPAQAALSPLRPANSSRARGHLQIIARSRTQGRPQSLQSLARRPGQQTSMRRPMPLLVPHAAAQHALAGC